MTTSLTPVYASLIDELKALFADIREPITNMANCAAALFHRLDDVNWAGFYLRRDRHLFLGPFQGMPACVRIEWGRGVCGTSAQQQRTILVPDVHQFPGHIACDSRSRSEIVVPLIVEEQLIGVLDLDSPHRDRFTESDALGLEQVAKLLMTSCDWSLWPNDR